MVNQFQGSPSEFGDDKDPQELVILRSECYLMATPMPGIPLSIYTYMAPVSDSQGHCLRILQDSYLY